MSVICDIIKKRFYSALNGKMKNVKVKFFDAACHFFYSQNLSKF